MIVCSCNNIDSEKIKNVLTYAQAPSEKMVLDMLNWKPECSVCAKQLTEEIRRQIEIINNVSLIEGEDNGC